MNAMTDPIPAWHLTSSIWPPVDQRLIPVCALAISYGKDDDFDTLLTLPDGIEYHGMGKVPVRNVIEDFHLDDFLDSEVEANVFAAPEPAR